MGRFTSPNCVASDHCLCVEVYWMEHPQKYSFFLFKVYNSTLIHTRYPNGSQSMPHLFDALNKNNIPSPPSVPHEIHEGSQAPNRTSPSVGIPSTTNLDKKHVHVVTLIETLGTYTANSVQILCNSATIAKYICRFWRVLLQSPVNFCKCLGLAQGFIRVATLQNIIWSNKSDRILE